jgi:N-acetyl-anhydromuramyl-L-alanine amidase AmpD
MPRIVIDPGHGGDHDHGRSSALGARGAGGLLEKHVTLDVARHVVAGLGGGATLTRSGDRNLSLRERAGQASGADVFVSIHANQGPPAARGAETWIHPDAAGGSRALAASIQGALERLDGRYGGGDARAAAMAVLAPAVIGRRTDACLVEVDYLTNPDGAARLGDPAQRQVIGHAIAAAIRAHVDRRYGDGEPDVEPGIDGPIPDDAVADGEAVAMALQAVPPEYSGARRYVEARAGHFRVPATPRTIDRIVIHITDGTSTNGTVGWFRSASNTQRTSAHYVIGQDGEVVQMVRHANIAHHATTANRRSIGIEHVALSPAESRRLRARGRNVAALLPTEEQYRASARLVAWLCCEFAIPVDREHIIGHSEAAQTTHSDCPNSVWDWDAYMGYVREYYRCERMGDYPTPPPSNQAIGARRARGYGDAAPSFVDGCWSAATQRAAFAGRIGGEINPFAVVVHTTDMTPETFDGLLHRWTTEKGDGTCAHFLIGRDATAGVVQLAPITRNANHAGGPGHGNFVAGDQTWHPNLVSVGIELHCAGGVHLVDGRWRLIEDGRPTGLPIPEADVIRDPQRPGRAWHKVTEYQYNQLQQLLADLELVLAPLPDGCVARSVDEPARYARFATGRVVAHASLDWHDRADPWPPTCDWLRAILAARPPRF